MHKYFLVLTVPLLYMFWALNAQNAISYTLSSGRFGDHILAFSKALYLAHSYKIPFLYVPFTYSSHLNMHTLNKYKNSPRDKHIIPITPTTPLTSDTSNTIFMADLGTRKDDLTSLDSIYSCMIADPFFAKLLKHMLTPRVAVHKLVLPENVITVALHVRKGGGFDKPLLSKKLNDLPIVNTAIHAAIHNKNKFQYSDQRWPHKFPSDQYYIDQLIFLSELLDNPPLYVYLFTDDPHPKKLVKKYSAVLNKPNITFEYRTEKNQHNMNVLDDYWNMAQFDCLIRAASNFSRSVQLLGDHKIIITVKHAEWTEDKLIVDRIGCVIRNDQKDIYINKSLSSAKPNEKLLARIKQNALECFGS